MPTVGAPFEFSTVNGVPLLKHAYFTSQAARLGAGQKRHQSWNYYQEGLGFLELLPLAQCFLSDGVTPATNNGSWGTLLAHWKVIGAALPTASSVPVLAIERATEGNVTFLIPKGHSTSIAAYRAVLVPRNLATIVNTLEAGVVADSALDAEGELIAGKDNSAVLLGIRDSIVGARAFLAQPKVIVNFSGGVVSYKNNKLFVGINHLTVNLNNTTLIPDYDGLDNMLGRSTFTGELFQKNVNGYVGSKSYIEPLLINSVEAGSVILTVTDPSKLAKSAWFEGARILVYGRETVFRGYPPGATAFEDGTTKILSINYTTGQIVLSKPLAYSYLQSYPDYTGTTGALCGIGRVLSLDNPDHPYPEFVRFSGGSLLTARNTPEAFALPALHVELEDITAVGNVTPTEAVGSWTSTNCDFDGEMELDKLNGPVKLVQTRVHRLISNGGGTKSFVMIGGRCDTSIQISPPSAFLDGVECNAQEFELYDVSTNTTIHKTADPAVSGYAGMHVVREFRIRNLKLSAENQATSYLGLVGYLEYKVVSLSENRIKVLWDGSDRQDQLLFWKCAAIGTSLFTIDGAKGGKITSIDYAIEGANKYFYVGYSGPTLAINDVVTFTNTFTVRDDGGHTITTPSHPAKIYSDETLIWKNNQLPASATTRSVTITKSDMLFNGNQAAYFKFRAFPRSVSFTNPSTSAGKVKVTMLTKAESPGTERDLCCFALNSTSPRACSGTSTTGMTSITSGEPGLNQYLPSNFNKFGFTCNVFVGDVSLVNAPEFSLTFTFDVY
jgi:hypothetical protein